MFVRHRQRSGVCLHKDTVVVKTAPSLTSRAQRADLAPGCVVGVSRSGAC
jgi:hypothetical protein